MTEEMLNSMSESTSKIYTSLPKKKKISCLQQVGIKNP